jgi:hypothetical protein
MKGPRLAVYRWAGAGEPGSEGDLGSYVSGLGQPPFHPRMMVSLLLHGYASGPSCR